MSNEQYLKEQRLHNLRHTLAHLLAASVREIYPGAKNAIGPAIEDGFYQDFDLPNPISDKDLPAIQKKMRQLALKWTEFIKQDVSVEDAKKTFAWNEYKTELINEFAKEGKDLTFYISGGFVDLCKGGHVVHPNKDVKPDAFKLTKTAGAYWRGDEKNKMLTRIYGVAFESKEELDNYLVMLAEAEKGPPRFAKLGLFLFNEMSPGIPFYQPKGSIVRNELEKFVREYSYGPGYHEVKLPQLFDAEIFKISGHWEHYKADMFTFKVEEKDFALKPMNCPGHMQLFKQGLYSYRDLPLRLGEMSTLYRNELTGVLNGLTRVRAFAQDDCHIFLTPEQVSGEVVELLNRITKIYKVFGMKVEDVCLSTRPEKFLGVKEDWDKAEAALSSALDKAKWKFQINEGDGAFYGPKIDMQIRDVLGRKWQLATVQLDFQQPKRFGLEYVDKDGAKKTPVVIHRALIGSFERFLGILIEHYAGAFPLWLAPVQVKILPISKKQNIYAKKVMKELVGQAPGLRIELDDRDESVGKKIREASMQKIPYQIILGEKEMKAKKIAVRTREGKDLGQMKLEKFVQKMKVEIEKKK